MRTRCLFLYRWAGIGGVERVLLNRAAALHDAAEPVEMDIHFYEDAGGLGDFARSIRRAGLGDWVRLIDRPEVARYDAVFAFDTPAALGEPGLDRSRLVIECHTAHQQGRRYLARLGSDVAAIVGPSAAFVEALARELPHLSGKMRLLRNFVRLQPEQPHETSRLELPAWTWRPLLGIGRLDALKNPAGILAGLQILVGAGHAFGALLVGPRSPEFDLVAEVRARNLAGRVVWLPPLGFDRIGPLLRTVRRAGGLYVSCSRAESFGLAAAEAASVGIPTLLSDLPAHRALVQDDPRLLFPAHDAAALARCVIGAAADHARLSGHCAALASELSPEGFVRDWKELLDSIASTTTHKP